jgi:hypothetical protein
MLATMTENDLLLISEPLEMNPQGLGSRVLSSNFQMLQHRNR